MYTDHPISQAEHDRWFEAALAAADRRYWIIEMDEAPVGLANLAKIDPAGRRCEWAYYLGEPSTRGQGLGSRIEYIVLRYVFETAGLKPELRPTSDREYRTAARRTRFSALSNTKMERCGIAPMPPLDEAIRSYMDARQRYFGK